MSEPIPEEIGVIVLPGTVLFPHALLPLFIFEPRYQLMVERALEDGRVFAVGTRRPGGGADDAFPVGGAGVIRACVRNPDGTANLVLQGLRRVRFTAWPQTEPYRVARVEPLASRNGQLESAAGLATVVKDICAALTAAGAELPPQFERALSQLTDADTLSDAVTAALVEDPDVRRELFEELDVPTRLRALMTCLRAQLDDQGRP